ncbi:MAG: fibronectin type III domain-containing protein [Lachnospiraceae bacterium]|nr:fibronectin type III domain-containing protein [Lachnospiraceae bacterium]
MKLARKMLKFYILLCLSMIVTVYGNEIVANAATTEDGLEYEIRDGGVVITAYSGNNTEVTIPKEILGYKVMEIGEDAFCKCEKLKSVTILANLDCISSYAFYYCENLESFEMKGIVKEIKYGAFESCSSLTEVKLSEGLEIIDWRAFAKCTNLTSVNLPNTLKEIGNETFLNCKKLKTINIPKNVEFLGYKDSLLGGKTGDTFWGCENLMNINVSNDNKEFASVDGVLYTKDMKILLWFPQSKQGQYIIPNSVTTISACTCCDMKISKLAVPDSVKEIGEYCFENCKEDLAFYCSWGSYALEYAINNNIKFDVDNYLGNFTATISQPSFGYTGDYIKPVVTVKGKVNGKAVTLTNWKDYKVTYKNFKNPGTASITVTGRGNYVGKLSLTFTIRPIDISKFSATIKQSSFAYTGNYIKPIVTVKGTALGKAVTLANWKDYKITYKNFKNPGQATMTITGRGIYGGSKTIKFYIRPSQVKNVKYVDKSTSYVNFKWDKCVGVTGYEVYRSTSKTGTYTKVGTVSATSFKNTGLKKGTTYYYKVRAYKTVGSTKLYGAYSSVYTLATSK